MLFRSDGASLPSKNIASTDDASSILVNPGNLAFGAGPEARLLYVHTPEDSQARFALTMQAVKPWVCFEMSARIATLTPVTEPDVEANIFARAVSTFTLSVTAR